MNKITDILFTIFAIIFSLGFWFLMIYAGMNGLASL